MKKQIIQMLCFGFAIFTMACNNSTDPNQIIEQGRKSFIEHYKIEPDTCIRLDETRFLFVNKVKKEMFDSIYFHVFVHQDKKWSPIFSTGLEQYTFAPINDLGLQNIQGLDYFYVQYELGGGSMGNNSIEFLAYRLEDSKEYSLSYNYYPLGLSTTSSVTPSDNLIVGGEVYNFLYEKVKSSNQYKKDEFFQNAEKRAKIPVVTNEAIAEKTSNYIEEYKGDQTIDGLRIRYFVGEDQRRKMMSGIYSTSLYATVTDSQGNFIVNDCFAPSDIHPDYKDIPNLFIGSAEFKRDDYGKLYLFVTVLIADSDSIYDEWIMKISRTGTVTWELLENEHYEELE